jgi:hypothetical protein
LRSCSLAKPKTLKNKDFHASLTQNPCSINLLYSDSILNDSKSIHHSHSCIGTVAVR